MSVTATFGGTRLFHRDLPGGGYVAIEVTPCTTPLGEDAFRGEIVVERRADVERRGEHAPPVIARATRGHTGEVLDALFPLAVSNAVIARRLLRCDD